MTFTHPEHVAALAASHPGTCSASMPADPRVEHIWREIQTTALRIAHSEPLLFQRMQKLVLMHDSFADMAAAILAHKLACEDMHQEDIFELIRATLHEHPTLQEQIATDIIAAKMRDPACLHALHVLLNMKGFHALGTYRVFHALWRQERQDMAFFLSNLVSNSLCVDIHPAAIIGSGVMIDHGSGVVIGETTRIDDDVSILQNVTLGGTGKERGDRHPKIRSGVLIGAGATILGNIEIGSMSKIAAGSVVLSAVPSHCTVAGVPAKVVRRHFDSSLPAFDMDQSIVKNSSEHSKS